MRIPSCQIMRNSSKRARTDITDHSPPGQQSLLPAFEAIAAAARALEAAASVTPGATARERIRREHLMCTVELLRQAMAELRLARGSGRFTPGFVLPAEPKRRSGGSRH